MNRNIVKVETEVLLLDIRGYSRKPDEKQLLIVETLTDRLRRMTGLLGSLGSIHVKDLREDDLVIGYIPTGDGAYVILNPLYGGYGILLATAIRNDLVLFNKKLEGALYEGIRVAVHLGPCIPFLDITGRVNFVGRALNDCARISNADEMDPSFPRGFTDGDYVVASADAIACFDEAFYSKTTPEYRNILAVRRSSTFTIRDKHENEHSVQLIEMNRHVAIQPFNPAVSLSEGERQFMREIAGNRLPSPPRLDCTETDRSGSP